MLFRSFYGWLVSVPIVQLQKWMLPLPPFQCCLLYTSRTVTGFPSFVFLGMYSMASLTTFSLVIRYRSLTRQPISVWNINISLCIASCGVADRSALKILSLSSSAVSYTHLGIIASLYVCLLDKESNSVSVNVIHDKADINRILVFM